MMDILELSMAAQEKAREVLAKSGIADVWLRHGCRVNVVGSMRMGLLISHRDVDLHVYSKDITEEKSFAIAAEIAKLPHVTELKCINGLHTDEHCIAWHISYLYGEELWKLDIIHIEEGSEYDGYFERMADRIVEVMTKSQKETILRLKYETPSDKDFRGVEYYEAVIADGVRNLIELEQWIDTHRKKPSYYWIP